MWTMSWSLHPGYSPSRRNAGTDRPIEHGRPRNATNDLDAAGRAGRRTRNVLRSLGHPSPVTPVLIVWGKGRATLPHGYKQVQGVYVVEGDGLD
jgi:hypothetical protein